MYEKAGKLGQAPVGTLERGLAVLGTLGQSAHGMTLTELATSTGLPKQTTSRLLATLVDFEFVEKHGVAYRIGYQCFRLGNLYTFDEHLQRRARPIMERLKDQVQEVVQLGTLSDHGILYLERVEPRRSIAVVPSQPGSIRPAYCTALGKVLLSQLGTEELAERLRETYFESKTPKTITSREALLTELEATRRRGYAVDEGESDEEIGCVAAPIFDNLGRPVAAISVSAPRFRISGETRTSVANRVVRAASELSGN